MIKKIFTWIGIICTSFVCYLMCSVIMEDDETTNNEQTEAVADADTDEENPYYDEEDDTWYYYDEENDDWYYYDEDDDEWYYIDEEEYEDDWKVEDAVADVMSEFNVKDKETQALVTAILKKLKEEGSEIHTSETEKPQPAKPAETKPNKPAESHPAKPAETKPSKPAETKPAETKPSKPTETKPAETKPSKPAATKPTETKPAAPVVTTGNRKVTAINDKEYKSKLADFTKSKTVGKKGVNAVVLFYLSADKKCNSMVQSMNTLANEFPNIDLYTLEVHEGVDLLKTYMTKELPVLFVIHNEKVEVFPGSLHTESLRTFLKKY